MLTLKLLNLKHNIDFDIKEGNLTEEVAGLLLGVENTPFEGQY
jgi:hypothetical protein